MSIEDQIPCIDWIQLKINMFFPLQVFKHMAISDGENEVRTHIKLLSLFKVIQLEEISFEIR
jgi:hypothetical protein